MQGKVFPHGGKNMAVFVHIESGRQAMGSPLELVVFLRDRCHCGLINPANHEEERICYVCILLRHAPC